MNKAGKILVKKGKKLEVAGNFSEAISCYEGALKENPQNPDILFALGNVAKKMGAIPIAEQMFRTVYGLLPDSIEAATNLAMAISDQDRYEEAIDLYKALLAAHPEHVGTWNNIANTVLKTGDIETAEIFYKEALRLKPGSVEALTNMAEICTQKEQYDEALAFIDKALKREKNNPFIRFNRGQILLSSGNLKDGWKELDHGSQNRKDVSIHYHHKLKRWGGEDLVGKKILISSEQGIADQVRFLHCLEEVSQKADHVVLEIDPRLVSIVARTYPTVEVKAFNSEKIANITHFRYDWAVNDLDYSCNALNLFKYLRISIEDFTRRAPKFKLDEILNDRWRARAKKRSGALNVGLCWRSGKLSEGRSLEYADISEWGPVLKSENAVFYSLMYDECSEEVSRAKELFGCEIITFDDLDYRDDLEQVFALTNQMDLVFSTNSAPASFAGVLGVPTYMPSRRKGWDMLGTDHLPMVPCMKPIVQKTIDEWEPVFHKLASILGEHTRQK